MALSSMGGPFVLLTLLKITINLEIFFVEFSFFFFFVETNNESVTPIVETIFFLFVY